MSGDRRLQLDARAVVVLVVCCMLWGLAQVAIKVTLAEVPPLLQAASRSAGAALLLLLWILSAAHRSFKAETHEQGTHLIFIYQRFACLEIFHSLVHKVWFYFQLILHHRFSS